MIWDLPIDVVVGEKTFNIRNKCDYRVVLDAICALDDEELTFEQRINCALIIFYEDLSLAKKAEEFEILAEEMYNIMNGGKKIKQSKQSNENSPRLMDWEFDFERIAPPVNRVLGYDVRDRDRFTHWMTFLGAYMEIGDCSFTNIVSIRSKLAKNKKLEKHEQQYLKEHRDIIILPNKIGADDQEFLDSDW